MGVKINVPLIMLVMAQIAILVFGIIELHNPSRNWAFYNKETTRFAGHTTGGCTFKPVNLPSHIGHQNPVFNGPDSGTNPQGVITHPQVISQVENDAQNSGSYSDEDDESSNSEVITEHGIQQRYTISYNRQPQKAFLPRPKWIELGWRSWCNQFHCGPLVYGASAIAKYAALYGAGTSIVGSILMIIATFLVAFNDNKRIMNSKLLVSAVVMFLIFLLAATATSWIVWVVHVHKYVHALDKSYSVSYGYCFVLAILASCMEFFSLMLVLLSRWRFGMELPIGEDEEEEAYYSKLHSQRVANLL